MAGAAFSWGRGDCGATASLLNSGFLTGNESFCDDRQFAIVVHFDPDRSPQSTFEQSPQVSIHEKSQQLFMPLFWRRYVRD